MFCLIMSEKNITTPNEPVEPLGGTGKTVAAQSDEIIRSTVILVQEGEMNVTGKQFAEWCLQKYRS